MVHDYNLYQVQIMRGESPKSYVGVARGQVDFSEAVTGSSVYLLSSPVDG